MNIIRKFLSQQPLYRRLLYSVLGRQEGGVVVKDARCGEMPCEILTAVSRTLHVDYTLSIFVGLTTKHCVRVRRT